MIKDHRDLTEVSRQLISEGGWGFEGGGRVGEISALVLTFPVPPIGGPMGPHGGPRQGGAAPPYEKIIKNECRA